MGSTSTVTIGSDTITIYGSSAGMATFINGRFSPEATKWRLLSADDKARTLVSASQALDARLWQGSKTVSSQPLDWPRTDVVDENNASVDSATVPDRVVEAEYELALMIGTKPGVQTQANAGSNVKMLKAGPVDIEYFRPTDGVNAQPFPDRVMLLIGVFLSGSTGVTGSKSFGTSCVSSFDSCATDDRSQPF